MKDILVAIDFSKGSVHALEYAIELANVAQSNITLVWIDVQAANETQGSPESGEFRDESKKNLEELVHTYKGKLTGGKLNCKIRKGKVYQELAAQAKQNNSSLLILGAHGVSGFEEYWIGSNASRVVAYSPCPVITIKFNFDNSRGIRKILVPIDHTPQTIQKAIFACQLAKVFGSDINILAIHTSRLKTMQRVVENNVVKIEKYLNSNKINFILDTVLSDNLTSTIIEHAKNLDVDIVAIMSDWQNEASVTILGQFAQQLVNYSPVPVLSIPQKEHFILQ
ncbi:MAG: universal stress protein [Bacteroidales bacterium]|nr:universal stress protein [Bacteroidales bacterium]